MKSVREIYESFGLEVIQEVERYLAQHGDLTELLQRFHLQVPSRLDQQHEILSQFLYKYGITFFLKALRNNLSAAEIEHLKVMKLVSRVGSPVRARDKSATAPPPLASEKKDSASSRSLTPVPLDCDPSASVHATPPPDGVAVPGMAPGAADAPPPTVHDGASRTIECPNGATITEINGRLWIVTADYVGWDRRSGVDRRSGLKDRRRETTVVFKNRRFGGRDRRKTVRRAEDRARLEAEQAARSRSGAPDETGKKKS
ncbi:MAG: hypothetical protein N2111_07235 [Candidatus Sumerlaeaceae bacterium]|nr:hypothetical protein [Candidatus Sumerlaeaceae bacterium]